MFTSFFRIIAQLCYLCKLYRVENISLVLFFKLCYDDTEKYHNFESEVQIMSDPIFSFTEEDVLAFIEKILDAIKKVFAWLGILVLPNDGEYDYPTEPSTDDPLIGA